MNLFDWAAKWNVSADALVDLRLMIEGHLPVAPVPPPSAPEHTEAYVLSSIRLEAARKKIYLWRNNVGAGYSEDGSFMRWGLANDSKKLNEALKSADLIGCRPVVVTPAMVGHTIGQFVSRECKEPGWKYSGTPREKAQLAWAKLILSLGGDAGFATNDQTL